MILKFIFMQEHQAATQQHMCWGIKQLTCCHVAGSIQKVPSVLPTQCWAALL